MTAPIRAMLTVMLLEAKAAAAVWSTSPETDGVAMERSESMAASFDSTSDAARRGARTKCSAEDGKARRVPRKRATAAEGKPAVVL